MAIDSATLLSGLAFWRVSESWRLELRGMNLLDQAYFPSADDKSQAAPGRTFGLFVTWSGS